MRLSSAHRKTTRSQGPDFALLAGSWSWGALAAWVGCSTLATVGAVYFLVFGMGVAVQGSGANILALNLRTTGCT